ncbi:VPLPA-CTERM sorting domain-containing protein [Poseidonocella sedimentorum]|uniref:VPLPA-CTERM protein sorting domain-containing protein n=1 Tax=Poseidonocella sedimentorum TaxID=871652 RepID=A0A1I6DSJ0_9RHOB|nr:VPLPA-CTERM sorting domain-containing protein [Poseidonocella sedimentorum]SFR08298.1 VPLPA-CTERM protein sorting domain-containing protein [Poseidonocella sedimentorum]
MRILLLAVSMALLASFATAAPVYFMGTHSFTNPDGTPGERTLTGTFFSNSVLAPGMAFDQVGNRMSSGPPACEYTYGDWQIARRSRISRLVNYVVRPCDSLTAPIETFDITGATPEQITAYNDAWRAGEIPDPRVYFADLSLAEETAPFIGVQYGFRGCGRFAPTFAQMHGEVRYFTDSFDMQCDDDPSIIVNSLARASGVFTVTHASFDTPFSLSASPDVVPLPAGLPLALTALGGFALVRRRSVG